MTTETTGKPNVLVLGACGFVGRYVVEHLVAGRLANLIRAVDKTPPQMAWLNAQHTRIFANADVSTDGHGDADGRPYVQFVSANLIDADSCARAFAADADDDRAAALRRPASERVWDVVINCAAETRPGRTDAVHSDGTVRLSANCARQAYAMRCVRFVELSSGNMHTAGASKRPADERTAVDAWTAEARHKALVERDLRTMPVDFAWSVLRLPLVYGPGDRRGLTHRITIAAIYKYLGDPMKLLWTAGLRLNTVHVRDAAAAIWYVAGHPDAVRELYNVVDDAQSTQGTLSTLLADIYGVRVEYFGTIMSSIAKVNIFDALDEINDKHMAPWAELCENNAIRNTPLTPYMDAELLDNRHLHLDNGKLKRLGFVLRHPLVTRDLLVEIVRDFAAQKLMPVAIA